MPSGGQEPCAKAAKTPQQRSTRPSDAELAAMKRDQHRRRKLPKQDRLHCVGDMFYCSPDLQQAYMECDQPEQKAAIQTAGDEGGSTCKSQQRVSDQGYDRVIVDAECTHDGSIKVRWIFSWSWLPSHLPCVSPFDGAFAATFALYGFPYPFHVLFATAHWQV
jgi:hypothetical protein